MKRKIVLLMAAMVLTVTPGSNVAAGEMAGATIVVDEAAIVPEALEEDAGIAVTEATEMELLAVKENETEQLASGESDTGAFLMESERDFWRSG